MRKFFIQEQKLDAIIDFLSDVNKRRRYSLYLISYNLDENCPINFFKKIVELINLKEINIYIDQHEVFRLGIKKIKNILKRIKLSIAKKYLDITLNLFCVKVSSGLFHSKAYMLVNYDFKKKFQDGRLVIGSGNLSNKGISNEKGNIEILIGLKSKKDLELFINALDSLNRLGSVLTLEDFTQNYNFADVNSNSWKYSLLKSGYFVHKWSDNLRNELAVKFNLSKNGMQLIQPDELIKRRFNVESKSISKNYFEFDFPNVYLGGDKFFLKHNGLETYLGHWIPKSSLDLENDNNFTLFKEKLEYELRKQQEYIINEIEKDKNWLIEKGYIENYMLRKFTDDYIEDLLSNELKLYRIYTKYYIFELPLDPFYEDEIQELYDDLINTFESKKQNIPVCKILNKTLRERNLKYLLNRELYTLHTK